MVKFDVAEPEDKKSIAGSSSASSADGGSVNGERKRRKRDAKERNKKKHKSEHDGSVEIINGGHPRTERRESLSKAARDPRDIPDPKKKHKKHHKEGKEGKITRSPSPVIDFDGLSRPSKLPRVMVPLTSLLTPACSQAEELENVLKRTSNKPPSDYRSSAVPCAPFLSVLERTQTAKGCWRHLRGMPKQCSSSPKDTSRMSPTLSTAPSLKRAITKWSL